MTKSLYRVTAAAGLRVHGLRLGAGDLLSAHPDAVRYEVDLGHLVETTVEAEARPLHGLTDAERANLPAILPDNWGEPVGVLAQGRWSEGAGTPMVEVPMEPDGEGGFVGILAGDGPDPAPEA